MGILTRVFVNLKRKKFQAHLNKLDAEIDTVKNKARETLISREMEENEHRKIELNLEYNRLITLLSHLKGIKAEIEISDELHMFI